MVLRLYHLGSMYIVSIVEVASWITDLSKWPGVPTLTEKVLKDRGSQGSKSLELSLALKSLHFLKVLLEIFFQSSQKWQDVTKFPGEHRNMSM